MKEFAALYKALDQTNSINEKIDAIVHYLNSVDDHDKIWLIALFSGRKIKRTLTVTQLRKWSCEWADIPDWLFEECYRITGDLAETIAKILPENANENNFTLSETISLIEQIGKAEETKKKELLYNCWFSLNGLERFVFNKLITGGFRVGVSQKIVCKALSVHLDTDEKTIAHRIMGKWSPSDTGFRQLLVEPDEAVMLSKPYPFCLASPVEATPFSLGEAELFTAEWKWDGIRGQYIKREGQIFLWSRGEELITERFPELSSAGIQMPDGTVLDGEIMAFKNGKPLLFKDLQTRINRKSPGRKLLADVPVIFMAYDLLEYNGTDSRTMSYADRRRILELLIKNMSSSSFFVSEILSFNNWAQLENLHQQARNYFAEGLMLKRKDSVYEQGRKRGAWWKWKCDPYTIDAVLLYAQSGHGRRAGLYTDYTFALWNNDQLIPFAKAYSGLDDKEIMEVNEFIKANTKEKFGPVRSVTPELVFELGFEAIQHSARHKSGVAVRFPRILRWRKDKPAAEANTLDDLKRLAFNTI